MLNQCTFIGRLTRNAELHHTQAGKPVTSFTLAVDRDFPNKDGEWLADFIDFVAFNKQAEKVCEKYSKGDLISVTGRLQIRPYVTKDNERRSVAEIVIEKSKKLSEPKRNSVASAPVPENKDIDYTQMEEPGSDVPFES